MAKNQIILTVRFPWWFFIYLETLGFFCAIFNADPNLKKLENMIGRFMTIEVKTE